MKTKKLRGTMLLAFLLIVMGCEKEALDRNVMEDYNLKANLEKRALSHTKQYDAEVATAWFGLLADLSRYTFYFNPQSTRIFAYSGLTLYESVVPGMPSYQSMFPTLSGETIEFSGKAKDYYWPASANAALAQMATKLLQDYPQVPNLSAIQQLEADFNEEFLTSITQEQLERSIEFGKQVADVIYEWSKTDRTFVFCPPYTPVGGLGNWVPTPPMYFPAAGACQGDLRTFIPNIAENMLPAPPPSYSTDPESEFYKMNEAVYELSFNLTPEDHLIIQAWRDIPGVNHNTPSHMTQITSNIIDQENLNLEDASVLLAKQGIAMFDAIVALFNAKYEYSLLRPVTYIHEVLGHISWNSVYPAPQHPSYPAVSTGAVGAATEILEGYFGKQYSFEDATQQELYGIFYYDSFENMLEDVGISRTHSGINYQLSVDIGKEMGRAVGKEVNSMGFKK